MFHRTSIVHQQVIQKEFVFDCRFLYLVSTVVLYLNRHFDPIEPKIQYYLSIILVQMSQPMFHPKQQVYMVHTPT
nr:MAG TPA: hypothetical protein [Bacteriophage sp.]